MPRLSVLLSTRKPDFIRCVQKIMPYRLLAFLMALSVLAACERRAIAPSVADVHEATGPVKESWGVHFYVSQVPTESQESTARFEIIADYLAHYEGPDSTYQLLTRYPAGQGNRVVVKIYDDHNDLSATVTTDRLLYFDQENRFEAQGEVVVDTPDDKRLETESLEWREEDRKVYSRSFVRITTADERVRGYGLVADEDLTTYQIGRFTARVSLDDSGEE